MNEHGCVLTKLHVQRQSLVSWSLLTSSRPTVFQQNCAPSHSHAQPLPYFTHILLPVTDLLDSPKPSPMQRSHSKGGGEINVDFSSLFEQEVKLEAGWHGFPVNQLRAPPPRILRPGALYLYLHTRSDYPRGQGSFSPRVRGITTFYGRKVTSQVT